jgi:hypothetical protein
MKQINNTNTKDGSRLCAAPLNSTIHRTRLCHTALKGASALALTLAVASHSYADTLVSGDVTGTWTKSSSPYRVVDNCTVPRGQTLTIQPGVSVILGQGLKIEVWGTISAVGTPSEKIGFRGTSSSSYWDRIFIMHGGGAESRFAHCNFSDAVTAVHLRIFAENSTMRTDIANCRFTNCLDSALFGDAETLTTYCDVSQTALDVSLSNCWIERCLNGCRFVIHGSVTGSCGNFYPPYGHAHPTLQNCAFVSIGARAISLEVGNYPGSSTLKLVNCLISACSNGVVTVDPWDCIIENTVLQSSKIGVARGGSLSGQVGYNCFFNNQTNFVGYPSSFGRVDGYNQNGTPADVAMNIFQNPLFADTNTFILATDSPCIDAGDPASAYQDSCFPPSKGTAINDIGVYGGPGACNSVVPTPPAITRQPSSQSSCLGSTALFSVAASGTPLPAYQWFHGAALLSGQTGTNLSLTNLQPTDAGIYQVVVTNVYGAVTSAPVQLVVNDACVDLCMYAGLNIAGQPGRTYELRYTTDLSNTNFATWTFLATNTTPWFYIDTGSCGVPKRFYGVKLLP